MRFRGFFWIIIIAAFGLLSIGGQILGFYIDWLWFREVQFTSVFLTILRTQALLGAVTAIAFAVVWVIALVWWLWRGRGMGPEPVREAPEAPAAADETCAIHSPACAMCG